MSREIVVIPGFGNHKIYYRVLFFGWRFLGYKVCFYNFNWGDHKLSYEKKVDNLLCFVLAKTETPDIIGISAGGTVAVNLLCQHPEIIKKVVTVCTPYKMTKTIYDSQLKRAIADLQANLKKISADNRERILAIRASQDAVVPVPASTSDKIRSVMLPIKGHALTITAALTIFRCKIRRFLSRKS